MSFNKYFICIMMVNRLINGVTENNCRFQTRMPGRVPRWPLRACVFVSSRECRGGWGRRRGQGYRLNGDGPSRHRGAISSRR
jgi:hypothetical protein